MGNRVGRMWWNAERFGLTPPKLRFRLWGGTAPRVISNSLPKAGTHLLERALCLHPRLYRPIRRTLHDGLVHKAGDLTDVVPGLRPGQVLVTHLAYREDRERVLESEDVRTLFLVRDPRDIVVSQANYIVKEETHSLHRAVSGVSDYQERLRGLIVGCRELGIPPLNQRLEEYAGWLGSKTHLVRYEDLIGAAGGGASHLQYSTLSGIYSFLGLDIESDDLVAVSERTFSSVSPTFRRGRIGQWREHFDATTSAIFEAEVGELAELYGYGHRAAPSEVSNRE